MSAPTGDLDRYARHWEDNARLDACFAVLSDPDRAEGGWEADPEAFLETGRREIDTWWRRLEGRGLLPEDRHRALDFGCGAGRLTNALAERFDVAVGVDVAPTMLERARELVPAPNAEFVLNQRDDLAVVGDGTVDLAYTNIVLQHLSRPLQERYLAELVRILTPGGVAVVQVPSRRLGVQGTLRRVLPEPVGNALRALRRPHASFRRDAGDLHMEMNCLPQERVAAVVGAAGGEILHLVHTNAAEPDFGGRLVLMTEAEARRRARGGGYLSPTYVIGRS